jgi:hypothetical protein
MITHRVFLDHPDFAAVFADSLNAWARTEIELADLMAELMGAPWAPSMATYNTLGSLEIRLSAIREVGRLVLPQEMTDDLTEVFRLVRKGAKRRNKLAHSLWGQSDQHPGCLIRAPHFSEILADKEYTEAWTLSDFVEVQTALNALFIKVRTILAPAKQYAREQPLNRERLGALHRDQEARRAQSKTNPKARPPSQSAKKDK